MATLISYHNKPLSESLHSGIAGSKVGQYDYEFP